MRQAAKVNVSRVFTVKRPFKRSPRLSSIRLLPRKAETSMASTWLKITSRSRFSGTMPMVNMVVVATQRPTTRRFSRMAICSLKTPTSERS